MRLQGLNYGFERQPCFNIDRRTSSYGPDGGLLR
jgi:hypothetical protein